MDNTKEEHVGMFLRVKLFLTNHAAELAGIADVALIKTRLDNYITTIFVKEAIATTDLTGITILKSQTRTQLETKCILGAAAGTSYSIKNNNPVLQGKVDYTNTEIKGISGIALYSVANVLFNNLDPIKASLPPFGILATDITAISTLNATFLLQEESPADTIEDRAQAGNEVGINVDAATLMLDNELDNYMRPVSISNPPLHENYESHRALQSQTPPSAPIATITVLGGEIAVLWAQPYNPDTLYFIKNDGPETVQASLSDTATTEGAVKVSLASGEKRQRTASTLAPLGDFLVVKNLGTLPTVVKLWVE
ncbi:MAG: hypothetical protein NTX03_08030 [Bacteroidetes bacterium]|nr:hypothetical protein [Bacteroidota bacterium]